MFELPAPIATTPLKTRSSHQRHQKPWYTRWPARIVALVLLVVVGVLLYGWKQIDDTMNDLNRVSTLPAQIQDQTAFETDGTPLANVPTVVPRPTESGPPPTIVIPEYEGVSPGGPVRQTAVALAHEEPTMASIAGASSGSAVAVAAATPTAIVGEEQAQQLLAGGMTFDTGPAQTAIAEAQQQKDQSKSVPDTSSFVFEHVQGSLQAEPTAVSNDDDGGVLGGIRDAASGAAVASGLKDASTEPMTILVMGVDARPGSAIDIGVRPDALMVLRLDPEAGTCRGLAVPRDSLVELPGYGETKINHALMLGGIPYEQLVMELYLGIDIDHYALIDFTGFEELVDAVGGVTITVSEDLVSPAVSAGTHTIDGKTALRHARYRGGPDGDFGRIKRQQQIMQALIATANGKDLLREANRLLPPLKEHIRTDLSIEQLVGLAKFYQGACSAGNLQMETIPGAVVYGPIIDPLFGLPLSYVVSDPNDVQERVDVLMGGEPR